MGFFANLFNKLANKTIIDTAQNVLKFYRYNESKYPHSSKKELFKIQLKNRYAILKTMDTKDIEDVVNNTNNLVALTLAIIAYENPIAINENSENTIQIVGDFFRLNAPEEFEIFSRDPDLPYAFIIAYEKMMGRL